MLDEIRNDQPTTSIAMLDEICNDQPTMLDEIRNNQPTINIGMIGSVSNGKSTTTGKITGIKTQRHSSEQKRNITIKLGYANAKIFQCPNCPAPECYQPVNCEKIEANCQHCDEPMTLKKHVSFVDAPGHNLLMATMLNGTCVMDTSILVESAGNMDIPAQQTKEHLIATEITGIKTSMVLMNKMDLVKRSTADEKIEALVKYLKDTTCKDCPVIPVAANREINIDIVCEYICTKMEEPERDLDSDLKMIVIRSFNINKQYADVSELKGGVVGGTVTRGTIRIGDKIKILPGVIEKNKEQTTKWKYRPLESVVGSINTETTDLKMAIPGGLIGVCLDIDPAFATKDGLVGHAMVPVTDNSYNIYEKLFVVLEIIEDRKSIKLDKDFILIINHNACNVKGRIAKIKKIKAEIELIERPICGQDGDYITISYSPDHSNNNAVLLGRARIMTGTVSEQII